MGIRYGFKHLLVTAVLLVPGLAQAAVILPALDIQDMGTDAGASVSASSFSIDATAFAIVFDFAPALDIADEAFTLNSSSGSYDSSADGGLGYGSFAGSFSVSGGLLSGTFSNLEVFGYGNNDYDFSADLVYTGGSLAGSFTGGRIEGVISGSVITAKLGEVTVVPVPAAVWLFATGLIGLVGVARRKAA